MKKTIMNVFKEAKPAKLEPCVAKDIQKLQDAVFNNKPEKLSEILEHIKQKHPEAIEQINKIDPSLFIAINKLSYSKPKII